MDYLNRLRSVFDNKSLICKTKKFQTNSLGKKCQTNSLGNCQNHVERKKGYKFYNSFYFSYWG